MTGCQQAWRGGEAKPEGLLENNALTLVELLVGVSIFAVIASSLSMTFANGILFSRRSESREAVFQDARWTLDALTRDLEHMVPYTQGVIDENIFVTQVEQATAGNVGLNLINENASGASGEGSFDGKADSLSFVIATDEGLRQVRYYLAQPEQVELHQVLIKHLRLGSTSKTGFIDAGQQHVLLLRDERPFPFLRSQDAQDSAQVEVLSFHAREESLMFSYALLAEGSQASSVNWENSWDKTDVPVGVRVEVVFADPDNGKGDFKMRQDIFVPLGMKGLL